MSEPLDQDRQQEIAAANRQIKIDLAAVRSGEKKVLQVAGRWLVNAEEAEG